MAIPLTLNALNASQQNTKELNLVFQIEGVDQLFGAVIIREAARFGDNLEIGDPELNAEAFFIGGSTAVDNQSDFITFSSTGGGTITTIRQQLQIDRGESSSITTFDIVLIDQNEEVTRLISPDTDVSPAFDLLGRRCKVFFGFASTNWPEDYVTIFRGIITDIDAGAGVVQFTLNHPDNKKRKNLFKEIENTLDGAMTAGQLTATVDDSVDFLQRITGPSGAFADSFNSYLVIDDEIMEYTTISGNIFTIIERGALNTTPATHDDEASVKALYRLQGNPMDIALSMMLSGWNGNYVEDIEVTNFNTISATETLADTIFIREDDVTNLYNLQVGDYITTTGSAEASNNVTLQLVTGIVVDDDGSKITCAGAGFVDEVDTLATLGIRSQYDVWPDGMQMLGDEVDIDQHLNIKNTFLPTDLMDFRLIEGVEEGKEFLEKQVYSPVAAFGIPRKSQASVGYHTGPVPGQDIKVLSNENVQNPDKLKIKRSANRYFYNEVVYRFDKDNIEDRFLGGQIVISQDSKNRIPGGARQLLIDAEGVRTNIDGPNLALRQGQRRLDRYQFGAERIALKPLLGDAFTIEVGDIILFDASALQISDIKNGSRNFVSRLMEVNNKRFNIQKGDVQLEVVDTNFDGANRYALISPCSAIKSGLSTTQFILEPSNNPRIGQNEFAKWTNLLQTTNSPTRVVIRSLDYSFIEESGIASFSGNTVTLTDPLSVTPSAGYVMELANYSSQPVETTLIYGFISDNAGDDFPDGTSTYVII